MLSPEALGVTGLVGAVCTVGRSGKLWEAELGEKKSGHCRKEG